MRIVLAPVALVAVSVVVGLGAAGWMTKAQFGLGRLMSGTIAPAAVAEGAGISTIAWHAPGAAADQAVALSEQDWLKLSDDVAPVSYLDQQPIAPKAPAGNDAQPL